MENQEPSVEIFEKFKWNIKNFSQLNVKKISSEPFVVGGYPCQTSHEEIGVPGQKPDVQDSNLVTCLPVSTIACIEPTKHTDAELFSPSRGELMDFSSVGHQQEMCSSSLNEPPPNRKCKFTDLAFSALGRVICFLKTRKVKDMNDQTCKDIQVLWEELKKYRFDLTWLEPHVEYALGAKSYVEKAVEVEKLKENVVALELETERLKAKLVAAKANFDIERDLLNAKGFEERDLDSELLGCESWRP
ncbi:unnamed protein product [Vicia faba]|uniref:Ubiquitin carboxyl-terminal hydrolase family protein n=1 Tax=Vicia faba TaxID=3906 RepID=A0AAV1B0B5_VICFA|nr:unnamed protein product [Vicia faba]